MESVIDNEQVPVGFALRNYFTGLRLNLHGTAGLSPFTYVDFQGFLEGIDGRYVVYEATDEISLGRFFTVADCRLIKAGK